MKMATFVLATSLVMWTILGLQRCHGYTEVCLNVPRTVDDCYAESLLHPISPKSGKVDCLQRLMWYYEADQNLTTEDKGYFTSLSRTGLGDPMPKTGYRIRKEYRTLTDIERQKLHRAFTNLYEKRILKKYADLHSQAVRTAHSGAAFLAWHRVFIALFEDELRLEDNTVSLPYWDNTIDEAMDNPVNSIIWSRDFLGNANGDVNTGPFAGWKTSRGNLWREYASHQRGVLTNDETINKILTRCRTDDIVYPLRNPNDEVEENYVVEFHHNGVHNWVGGDMSDADFAAYDPVFYMVHAFVDYQWELFRIRQLSQCGINPETDYAAQTGAPGHGPNDRMYGFDEFKNIDGLKNYWTKNWYSYESRPICPDCRSDYLYCDKSKNKCVSHSRRTDFNAGQYLQKAWIGEFGVSAEPFEPKTLLYPKRIINAFLPAPLSDGRTKESAKRDAKIAVLNLPVVMPVARAFEIQQPIQRQPLPRTKASIPFSVDTWVENLEPRINANNKNGKATSVNINLNINKYNRPVPQPSPMRSRVPIKLQNNININPNNNHRNPNNININQDSNRRHQISSRKSKPKLIGIVRSEIRINNRRKNRNKIRNQNNQRKPVIKFRNHLQIKNPNFRNSQLGRILGKVNQVRRAEKSIFQNEPPSVPRSPHRRRKHISLV